jgi:purine-nucleoside phosphorylase
MEHIIAAANQSVAYLRGIVSASYHYGIILGSGLGNLSTQIKIHHEVPYRDIPGFPVSTVEGHRGSLIFGELGGKLVLCMSGRFHYYEGYSMEEVTFPIRVMKLMGVETLLISNASGGMNEKFEVGDIMIITDHIYLQPEHPLRGKNSEALGTRFPNMSRAYDVDLVNRALAIASAHDIHCHTGVYVGVQGPTFETPAEYQMYHRLGGDAVGMSTTPETVVARHMSMRVFAISVISDMGYPFHKADEVSHAFVLEKAKSAEPKMTTIIIELLKGLE